MRPEKVDKAIVDLLCDLAFTLGLNNWEIGISPDPPDSSPTLGDAGEPSSALAQVTVTKYRRVAVVKIANDFLEMGHRVIFHTLVHEVCHLYFTQHKWLIEDQMDMGAFSVGEYNQLAARQHEAEEMAVDTIAGAFFNLLFDGEQAQKHLHKITPQTERTAP